MTTTTTVSVKIEAALLGLWKCKNLVSPDLLIYEDAFT